MPFPSKMYFAVLALLMLAVAHAAPVDPESHEAILSNTKPDTTGKMPALKRDNTPSFFSAPSPSRTEATRSMPMAIQARAPEIVSHSRTEEIRRCGHDVGESVDKGKPKAETKIIIRQAGTPRDQDYSSDKSRYQDISARQFRAPDYDSAGKQSNSTTEEKGPHPPADEEQNQSIKGKEKNGSPSTKDKESKEKRTVPVEWSKTWSKDR